MIAGAGVVGFLRAGFGLCCLLIIATINGQAPELPGPESATPTEPSESATPTEPSVPVTPPGPATSPESPGSTGQAEPSATSCIYDETNPDAFCPPCPKEQWLDLVQAPSGQEEIVNEKKTCFNPDPIRINYLYAPPGNQTTPELIGVGSYQRSTSEIPKGFIIRKHGFFRYAYDIKVKVVPGSGVDHEQYLDVDHVKKYFNRTNNDADVQVLEWPGKNALQHKESLEKARNDKLSKLCSNPKFRNEPSCKPYKYWMLQVERDNGKIQNYPCNGVEGTNILAVTSLALSDNITLDKLDPYSEAEQKIWVSHGRHSIYKDYLQPLFVPERILVQMGNEKVPEETFCREIEPDCNSVVVDTQQKAFCQLRCQEMKKKDPSIHCPFPVRRKLMPQPDQYFFGDLRTVHDFTFTKNRLILGMKCGILVVEGILTDDLHFRVSHLRSEKRLGPQEFKDPINKISASTCCSNRCSKDESIVAAYSYLKNRDENVQKFLYVSFDLGNTFEKRILGSEHTPLNLIAGLYQVYAGWHDYFEIVNNPDSDDLKEDDDFFRSLRNKPIWRSSTTGEREALFGVGESPEERRVKVLRKIMQINEKRVPRRIERFKNQGKTHNPDKTPEWVNKAIRETRRQAGWQANWTDANCESIPKCNATFIRDPSVEWLLNNQAQQFSYHVHIPKRKEHESFCKDITSIIILPEERRIMALCEVGYGKVSEGDNSTAKSNPSSPSSRTSNKTNDTGTGTTNVPREVKYYALYNFHVKENIPVIYGFRLSKRIFRCESIYNDMNEKTHQAFHVAPEIIRMQGSPVIFIKNCNGILYMSTNFGTTFFNAVFYYEYGLINKYCSQIPGYIPPPIAESCPEGASSSSGRKSDSAPAKFVRSSYLCALNVPPLLTADIYGKTLAMTFGKFYAFGAVSYNREQRLIVGEAVRELPYMQRFESLIYPRLDITGEASLTIALKHMYSIPETNFQTKLYEKRHALRLLPIPIQRYRDLKNFFSENNAICAAATAKQYGFPACKTNSFSVFPSKISMDIGDKSVIKVRVKAENPFLPLWISLSNEDSVGVEVFFDDRTANQLTLHNWQVVVKAKPNYKSYRDALVDAFFGSDYNKLQGFSTQISLINSPTQRCHVQSSTTVSATIGCKGKKLVAHEDSHRPQCKQFRKNFNYTLKKGTFDPELAHYWLQTDKRQIRPLFSLLDNGDLIITYDYSSWGCPIEPFRSDPFVPDLRIVDEENYNDTSLGERFAGKFILMEIFGATGFRYSRKVGQARCKHAPQNLKDLIQSWKHRQRIFELASNRLIFPRLNAPTIDPEKDVRGNIVFYNAAVHKHINIWNRGNYFSCETEDPSLPPLTEDTKKQEFQVMVTRQRIDQGEENDDLLEDTLTEDLTEEDDGNLNEIIWEKNHQRVYLFLAVAVDEHDSLCNYQTMFGVSLKVNPEVDDLTSFLVFLLLLILWLLLIIGGYYVRQGYLRIQYLNQARTYKLEEAAWKVVYRYEKLLHGKAIDSLLQPGMNKGVNIPTNTNSPKTNPPASQPLKKTQDGDGKKVNQKNL